MWSSVNAQPHSNSPRVYPCPCPTHGRALWTTLISSAGRPLLQGNCASTLTHPFTKSCLSPPIDRKSACMLTLPRLVTFGFKVAHVTVLWSSVFRLFWFTWIATRITSVAITTRNLLVTVSWRPRHCTSWKDSSKKVRNDTHSFSTSFYLEMKLNIFFVNFDDQQQSLPTSLRSYRLRGNSCGGMSSNYFSDIGMVS